MKSHRDCLERILAPAFVLIWATVPISHAQTLWTGPNTNYTHTTADAADPNTAANTDQITPAVWITRAGPAAAGIYNAVTQTSYGSAHSEGSGTPDGSPSDTEWAVGSVSSVSDAMNLTYSSWFATLHGADGVNQQAVVHLINENIYIPIVFTAFSSDGTYSYTRATPPPPPIILSSPSVSGGHFSFNYTANVGLTYVVESSSNLINWVPLSTNTATNTPVMFQDNSGLVNQSFYDVILLPSP